jgi:hypothetical protein
MLVDIIRERDRDEKERKGVKWEAVIAFATCVGSQGDFVERGGDSVRGESEV